jgi:hypothetical protein
MKYAVEIGSGIAVVVSGGKDGNADSMWFA